MTKIFCVTAGLSDGASIPRIHSIKHLEETGYPVQVRVGNEMFPWDIEWADIVLIHRPVFQGSLTLAQLVKGQRKKLWVDNDDDQLSIPPDHPGYIYYMREDTKEFIRTVNKMADVCTISNLQILKSYQELNPKIEYYPCAYDERIMPRPEFDPKRSKTIMWRGSNTQKKAFSDFAPAIAELDQVFSGWNFFFVGDYPWQIVERLKNNTWNCVDYYVPTERLWRVMAEQKPAIQMVLSSDNQFTKSRSNMAMIDGTLAGAVVVARDWDHFKTPGVWTYKDERDFKLQMTKLMSQVERGINLTHHVHGAWDYIEENQTFKVINKKQMEIIEGLMKDR